jgi:N-acetylglutamate synthase-like GNAT family acetyltransferase
VFLDKYIVRLAKREDLEAIRSLIRKVQINPIGLSWKRFLVAVRHRGDLLGCGQIKTHGDGSRELASIAVREQVRGHGVATAVIEALLARERHRPLYLMCREHLGSFYNKFRFIAIERKEMSPYFRRINWVERIINSRGRPKMRLLVMRLE